VRTGISPRELLLSEPEILDAMWRVIEAEIDNRRQAMEQAKARR